MADFNTHGGYFSPAGYMRINEGGSHEENPNGGVQVGVDPQGVPNMLEEGEPVYKDFVFSDNIKAQEQFLVEAGLPKRFAGKLYSEIVDELFAEAEERPNDPISRNGLDAMLSRVAEAQEAQKASEEEAQLMEEIQNMSPEEYAALEQAMMAQEQPVEQPMPGDEMVAPEQMAVAPEEQMQPEIIPTGYAEGGFLDGVRHFLNGPDSFVGPDGKEYPILKGEPPIVGKAVGAAKKVKGAVKAAKEAKQIAKNTEAAIEASVAAEEAAKAARVAHPWLRKVGKGLAWGAGLTAGAGLVGAGIKAWSNPDVEGSADDYVFDPNDFARGGNVFYPGGQVRSVMDLLRGGITEPATVGTKLNTIDLIRLQNSQNPVVLSRTNSTQNVAQQDSARGNNGIWKKIISSWVDRNGSSVPGGLRNLTSTGVMYGPSYLLRSPEGDGIYRNPNTGQQVSPGTVHVMSAPDTSNITLQTDDEQSEYIDPVRPTTVNVNHSTGTLTPALNPTGLTTSSAPIIPVPSIDPILSDAELDYISRAGVDPRSYEAQFGRIPIEPERIPDGRATTAGTLAGYNSWLGNRLKGTPATDVDSEAVVNDGRNGRPFVLSTLPRYAGAIGSGLLALNTLLQQPDHYEDVPIRPALPTGRILLQDQRYMPLDQNAVTNQMQAQNTANARAIMNSGAGPSTGALIAAADYTGGLNLGNALGNVWQANNQERNRVISANNQNAATRAQFYRDLDSQRAQILNNMALYNRQNALRVAMLNNQAEQDKYNAFGQNLGNSLKALSDIGWENANRELINGNTALGFGLNGFNPYYKGPDWRNNRSCGGFIKPYKKNK